MSVDDERRRLERRIKEDSGDRDAKRRLHSLRLRTDHDFAIDPEARLLDWLEAEENVVGALGFASAEIIAAINKKPFANIVVSQEVAMETRALLRLAPKTAQRVLFRPELPYAFGLIREHRFGPMSGARYQATRVRPESRPKKFTFIVSGHLSIHPDQDGPLEFVPERFWCAPSTETVWLGAGISLAASREHVVAKALYNKWIIGSLASDEIHDGGPRT